MRRRITLVLTAFLVAGCSTSTSPPTSASPSSAGSASGPSLGPVAFVGATSQPLGAVTLPATAANTAVLCAALAAGCSSVTQAMTALVLSADGNEADLPAIEAALGYHAIPYTLWIASLKPGQLTAAQLATGCAGKYQAVILATGGLAPSGGGTSALTDAEWTALRAYEAQYGVRELSWYTLPGSSYGLGAPNPPSGIDTSSIPLNATLTTAGAQALPYLNNATIPISGVG